MRKKSLAAGASHQTPTEGAYSAPSDFLAGFKRPTSKAPTFKGKEGAMGWKKGRRGEGR